MRKKFHLWIKKTRSWLQWDKWQLTYPFMNSPAGRNQMLEVSIKIRSREEAKAEISSLRKDRRPTCSCFASQKSWSPLSPWTWILLLQRLLNQGLSCPHLHSITTSVQSLASYLWTLACPTHGFSYPNLLSPQSILFNSLKYFFLSKISPSLWLRKASMAYHYVKVHL